MSRINQGKLDSLVEHLQLGGATDKASLASSIGATARTQDATINNYLNAIDEEVDENLVGITIDGDNPYGSQDTSTAPEDLSDEEVVDEEEEEEEEVETPEPKKVKKSKKDKKASKASFKFFLEKPDGTAVEITEKKRNGKIISFIEKPVTQMVKLMVKGKLIEVDLIPLRHEDQAEVNEHGVTNAQLLALAVAAQ